LSLFSFFGVLLVLVLLPSIFLKDGLATVWIGSARASQSAFRNYLHQMFLRLKLSCARVSHQNCSQTSENTRGSRENNLHPLALFLSGTCEPRGLLPGERNNNIVIQAENEDVGSPS
jgi:hypothetical protein